MYGFLLKIGELNLGCMDHYLSFVVRRSWGESRRLSLSGAVESREKSSFRLRYSFRTSKLRLRVRRVIGMF